MIRAAAAATLLAVALAGCSSDPEPEPLPPAPSASPTPAALPVPSEATPETAEGAAAFARYYLELLNVAFASGDASQVRTLSTDECGGCNNLIGAIEKGDEPGETVSGGEYRVVFSEAPAVENGDVIVDIRYSLTAVEVRDEDGTVETLPPKDDIDAQMRLLRLNGTWVVQGFRNTSP